MKKPRKKEKKLNNRTTKIKSLKTVLPYVENLAILLAVYLLSSLINDHLYMVDYQLVYIVITSFLLGKVQSLLSIGLGSAWFVFDSVITGRNLVSLVIDMDSLVHISLYIFAGLTIRFVLDRKRRMLHEYENEANLIKEKYQSLSTVHKDTLLKKEELQNQIIYTDNSVGTVYSIMKELNSLDFHQIYQSSVKIVEKMLKTDKVALYLYDQKQGSWRVATHSVDFQPVIESQQYMYLSTVVKTHEPFINRRLDKNLPSMIVPVVVDGHAAAVICIHQLEFEYLSLFYMNLMNVVAELIGSSLHLAYQHEEGTTGEKMGTYYSVTKQVNTNA